MMRSVILIVATAAVAANPVGPNHDPSSRGIDPFHTSWVCVGCKMWDENGQEKLEAGDGLVLRFERNRIFIIEENAPAEERQFRVLNPKRDPVGKLDILEKPGTDLILACYRFMDDRFYLCIKEDYLVRPAHCGPGRKHRLLEFVPYQPKRLFQTHPFPALPTPTE